MVWIYLLRCSDGTFYVGYTSDLLARERAHNEGPHESIESAVARERQLKSWTNAKKLALINGDLEKLKQLSRSHHRRRTTKVRESGKDCE